MTADRPRDLPDFEHPPLDEVVLSIQFAELEFKNYQVGLLWKQFADRYPVVEEQAPLPPVFETFGAPRAAPEIQELRFSSVGTLRYWFVSDDETQLIQVQPDRLIQNWRRRRSEDHYPRYEAVRREFETNVNLAAAFFEEHKLGKLRCNQCEVTYINAIEQEKDEDLGSIFTVLSDRYSDENLTHAERGQFALSYLMESETGGEPVGRLHVNAGLGIRKRDSAQVMRFNLTARGRPREESVEAAFRWLDLGRSSVVRAFASITTKKMHKAWGRRDHR